jgi:hypothetical protein
MSQHNPHHGDPHDSDHGQVESAAVSPKPVLLFLAVLFVATAFVFIVVRGMEMGLRKLDEPNQEQPATQIEAGRKLPPEPLLQGAPGQGSTATENKPTDLPLDAMENLRKETDKKLKSYGWVDKPGGIAHIPIDSAKAMIAEKGLPSLPSPAISEEVQKAETVRKEVLNAGSSAGRMIKIPAQSQQPAQQSTQPPAQPLAQQQEQKPQQNQQQVPPQHH